MMQSFDENYQEQYSGIEADAGFCGAKQACNAPTTKIPAMRPGIYLIIAEREGLPAAIPCAGGGRAQKQINAHSLRSF
jgi:hypothetical protein